MRLRRTGPRVERMYSVTALHATVGLGSFTSSPQPHTTNPSAPAALGVRNSAVSTVGSVMRLCGPFQPVRKQASFLNFPNVCPEPFLASVRFQYQVAIKWRKRRFLYRHPTNPRPPEARVRGCENCYVPALPRSRTLRQHATSVAEICSSSPRPSKSLGRVHLTLDTASQAGRSVPRRWRCSVARRRSGRARCPSQRAGCTCTRGGRSTQIWRAGAACAATARSPP